MTNKALQRLVVSIVLPIAIQMVLKYLNKR